MSERGKGSQGNSEPGEDINLYNVVLTPQEADGYFRRVKGYLKSAREHPYPNIVGRLRGQLAEPHIDRLKSSFGILLPLSHQQCVLQGEAVEATQANIGEMLMEVGVFLAGFRNTGITQISPDQVVPTMTAMLRGEKRPR